MSISSNVPETPSEPLTGYGNKLSSLERRVEILEAAQPRLQQRAWPPPPALVEQIKEITRSLFPGEVEAEIDFDPAEPNDPWMSFWVTSDIEYAQLRPLRQEWHERVEALGISDSTRFSLMIARA